MNPEKSPSEMHKNKDPHNGSAPLKGNETKLEASELHQKSAKSFSEGESLSAVDSK